MALVGPECLESAFARIHRERMLDVPILNSELEVRAVGFRDWEGFELGVLVTPWFMNLVLHPGSNPAWPELRVGQGTAFDFPAGRFDFLLGDDPLCGRYLACSLFSPVLEFEDQDAAVATAEAVMTALFDDASRPPPAQGVSLSPQREAVESEVDDDSCEPEASAPRVSRRALLRGGGGRAA